MRLRSILLSSLVATPLLAMWIPAKLDSDPIAKVMSQVQSGEIKLTFEPRRGYLDSLLRTLKIDPNSQVLVFSKTSLQTDFISRKTPRAIYFNADTYVGWIPGAPLIEIATIDPKRGVILYSLRNDATVPITFDTEPRDCNRCHGRRSKSRSPELFAESVYVSQAGYPRVFAPTVRAVPEVPLRQRWGGWYVTGTHGKQRHMGNEVAEGTDDQYKIDIEKGANVTSIRRYFDPTQYLSEGSDIVALMTLEQQMDVQNALTTAALGTSEDLDPLVQALLGCNETRLISPIKGTSNFAANYPNTFPKDHLGRSLGEFDLKTRLQKYPCSPLIYSRAFAELPPAIQTKVVQRIKIVLSGQDRSAAYDHLSAADRKAITEILAETHPEFGKN